MVIEMLENPHYYVFSW